VPLRVGAMHPSTEQQWTITFQGSVLGFPLTSPVPSPPMDNGQLRWDDSPSMVTMTALERLTFINVVTTVQMP
jgi:hypothetical protein